MDFGKKNKKTTVVNGQINRGVGGEDEACWLGDCMDNGTLNDNTIANY